MVECVSRKIQSKKMAKAFPFPQPTREKMQKREKNYAVFLSRGQISVAHSDLPWNNNVVLNGFVIYSNSCLFLFRNPHFISPSLPQMSQSNVQMLPIQTNAGQICYNATKWMWMRDTWIIKLPKLGHISAQKVGYCDTSGLLKFWWPNPTWGWRHNGRGKSVDARACAGVGHRRQPSHLLWSNILFYVARKHWQSLLFSRPKYFATNVCKSWTFDQFCDKIEFAIENMII